MTRIKDRKGSVNNDGEGSYTIVLKQNEYIEPVEMAYGREVTITLRSSGGKRYVSYDGFYQESLFGGVLNLLHNF